MHPKKQEENAFINRPALEYAILALKKYGLVKGLYKIYIRLFKTCRGIEYGIDYP